MRAVVYSLGVTLLQLMKLKVPWKLDKREKEKLAKHIEREVARAQYSASMKENLRAMLSWAPGDRPIAEKLYLWAKTELRENSLLRNERDYENMTSEQLAVEESKATAQICY